MKYTSWDMCLCWVACVCILGFNVLLWSSHSDPEIALQYVEVQLRTRAHTHVYVRVYVQYVVCIDIYLKVCIIVLTRARMWVCVRIYVRMHTCMYICIQVCMHVNMYTHIYVYLVLVFSLPFLNNICIFSVMFWSSQKRCERSLNPDISTACQNTLGCLKYIFMLRHFHSFYPLLNP